MIIKEDYSSLKMALVDPIECPKKGEVVTEHDLYHQYFFFAHKSEFERLLNYRLKKAILLRDAVSEMEFNRTKSYIQYVYDVKDMIRKQEAKEKESPIETQIKEQVKELPIETQIKKN